MPETTTTMTDAEREELKWSRRRIDILERELQRVADIAQKHHPIGQVKAIGLRECGQAIEEILADAADVRAYDLIAHVRRAMAHSEKAFGPITRKHGVVDHIRKELVEIEADPTDLEEWIDIIVLGIDGAWRTGATAEEIAAALEAKQTKNEGRVWPDWRTVPDGHAIEHDRSHDLAANLDRQRREGHEG